MIEFVKQSKKYTTHRAGFSSLFYGFWLLCLAFYVLSPALICAQDDSIQFIEKKQKEIREKEGALLKEEERLKILRKDVDERIEKYSNLLNQVENILKRLEQVQDEKFEHVVKIYEVMPPEEAAIRLSALSELTAVKIIRKMKPKKAGAIMASMDPKKVASLMESMTRFEKNFPTE